MADIYSFSGNDYALPKKTLAVAKRIDDIVASDRPGNTATVYKKEYQFIVETLGASAAAELLCGDSLNEVDVSMLTIVFLGITRAYNAKVEEYRNQETRDSIEGSGVDKIVEAGRAFDTIMKAGKKV